MIPLGETKKISGRAWATGILILLNVGIFLYTAFFATQSFEALIYKYGFEPVTLKSLNPHAYISMFTCMFLHGGLLHLLGNMVFLWAFGPRLEYMLGKSKFLQFYILVGLIATLSHAAHDLGSKVPLVGASGAISGILGAYLLVAPFEKISTVIPLVVFFPVFEIRAVIWIFIWVMLQFLQASSNQPDIAWWAHIGGFIGGGILLLLFKISGFARAK